MSRHNYSQYSNPKKTFSPADIDAPVEPTIVEDVVVAPVEETVETVTLPKMVRGVVTNCAKLNMRAKPSADAEVLCVLTAGQEVDIDPSKTSTDWCCVYSSAGVEGYCMQKYIDSRL